MENIIEKFKKITDETHNWDNWNLEEKKQLLEIYFIISKKENHIFDLIYRYHQCDSWESIFRDYDTIYLDNKESGVKIAINELNELIEESKKI